MTNRLILVITSGYHIRTFFRKNLRRIAAGTIYCIWGKGIRFKDYNTNQKPNRQSAGVLITIRILKSTPSCPNTLTLVDTEGGTFVCRICQPFEVAGAIFANWNRCEPKTVPTNVVSPLRESSIREFWLFLPCSESDHGGQNGVANCSSIEKTVFFP